MCRASGCKIVSPIEWSGRASGCKIVSPIGRSVTEYRSSTSRRGERERGYAGTRLRGDPVARLPGDAAARLSGDDRGEVADDAAVDDRNAVGRQIEDDRGVALGEGVE